MVLIYKTEVHTGHIKFSGTTNGIYVKLIGTEGKTDFTYLPGGDGGYSQGTVGHLDVTSSGSLGQLLLVELETKTYLFPVTDKWFCSKIVVTTPEGETLVFPVYRWLSHGQPVSFRDGVAKLVFKETIPEALYNRQQELEYRRNAYMWSKFADGLPGAVEADNPLSLPPEVQFSFTKAKEFTLTIGFSLAELGLQGYLSEDYPWSSMEAIHLLFKNKKSDIYKYVEKHWQDDEFFGYQFLNGTNPMLIHSCLKLPDNFPVTEDMVKEFLHGGRSLEEELQKGKIFLVDYKLLDGVTPNVINDKQQYLTAPLVLLYLNPDNKLMPIAIQLKQKPGEQNPIFLPSDSEYDWLLAKIFVRGAEFTLHEFNFHLLRTHLLSEVFAMATLRNFPMVHPLYKLLTPHFRYTLQIDTLARATLIAEGGTLSQYAAAGGIGMLTVLRRAMSAITYSSLCLPENIAERGLGSVPNFYYRDDGLKLWGKILSYVEAVVFYYYSSDSDVQRDTELQIWIQDVFMFGFMHSKNSGIPNRFMSVNELVKFLTMVIFTASIQHGAVNNGQFDFHGWMPNAPTSLQLPPPITKGKSSEAVMLQTFPDVNVTANGLAVIYLLAKKSTDFLPLGHYPVQLFVEEAPLQIIKDFQSGLKAVKAEIETRNSTLQLPYTYLNPDNVENSVAT